MVVKNKVTDTHYALYSSIFFIAKRHFLRQHIFSCRVSLDVWDVMKCLNLFKDFMAYGTSRGLTTSRLMKGDTESILLTLLKQPMWLEIEDLCVSTQGFTGDPKKIAELETSAESFNVKKS